MTLERGIYQIVSTRDLSKALPRYVGRFPVEDLSLRPKHIFNLPLGCRPAYPHWLVEPNEDGTYTLRALGAKTGAGDPKDPAVFAYLIDEMSHTPLAWKLIPVESTKSPVDFVVVLPSDESKGWTIGQETGRGELIEIKPIQATKSQPPQYKDTQVFNFLRINED